MNTQDTSRPVITPDDLRAMKSGLFSERADMDAVLSYCEQLAPDSRIAAMTVMGLTFNTLLELLAKQLEANAHQPASDE